MHIGRNVRASMQQNFEEREMERYGNIQWPALSPDLTPWTFLSGVDKGAGVPVTGQQPE